jgi:hypothetical protein
MQCKAASVAKVFDKVKNSIRSDFKTIGKNEKGGDLVYDSSLGAAPAADDPRRARIEYINENAHANNSNQDCTQIGEAEQIRGPLKKTGSG